MNKRVVLAVAIVGQSNRGAEFDLTLFPYVPCTISAFRTVASFPTSIQIHGECEENETIDVSGSLNRKTGRFAVSLDLEDGTQHGLTALNESHAVLYEFRRY